MDISLHCGHLSRFTSEAEIRTRMTSHAHLLDEMRAGFPECPNDTGWFHVADTASEEVLRRIEIKAEEVRRGCDLFVLIGVGGSNNAARAVIEAMPERDGPEIVYAGTSAAPFAIRNLFDRMEGKSVYINVIAKNFETLEPGAVFRLVRAYLYRRYGSDAARRIIATGTLDSPLHDLCRREGWDFFEFPRAAGGRYSALTNVGLLPMAIAGVDIRALTAGAAEMRARLLEVPAEENEALRYATVQTLLVEKGYRAELLALFEPRMRWFSKWWVQLFGESSGKDGNGLLPLACEYSEELHSLGQFMQDGAEVAFETFLDMEETDDGPLLDSDGIEDGFAYLDGQPFVKLNRAAFQAAIDAHSSHIPCLEFRVGPCCERTFGELFFFFMLSCTFYCRMLGVDPFDQPGVENYKVRMFSALGKPAR